MKLYSLFFLCFMMSVSSNDNCNYDIGKIQNLPEVISSPKKTVDYFSDNRRGTTLYYYLSYNTVIYYGNKCCNSLLSHQNIIDTANYGDSYLAKLQKVYDLHSDPILDTTRYTLYITNTGLDPYPPDPQAGVVGYAGDYFMAMVPDSYANIINDPSILIHEISHALIHIPRPNSWLEESICEYLAHVYVPTRRTIYDTTGSFLINQHYLNIFGIQGQTINRYDYGSFWAFIVNEYKDPKNIGRIVNLLSDESSGTFDIWEVILQAIIYNKHVNDTCNILSTNLVVKWVMSLVQLDFWRHDTITFNAAKQYLKNNNYIDKDTLVWNKPTIDNINQINSLIGKGGFEVLPYGVYDLPIEHRWRRAYITHYNDGTFKVSRFDVDEPNIKNKLLVIICVD